MPVALALLQLANAAFAAAVLWIHFRAPWMWDGQAIVYASGSGALAACLTALLLGVHLVVRDAPGWGKTLLNLVFVLSFAALQGYFLFHTARDIGLFGIVKSRLGGG